MRGDVFKGQHRVIPFIRSFVNPSPPLNTPYLEDAFHIHPGSWKRRGDTHTHKHTHPPKLNLLLNTAGSPGSRRYYPSFIMVGRGWHFGGSYKIISVTLFEKWNIPRKTPHVYWVVCCRELCESEDWKEVPSFELEWWSTTEIRIYTFNFDLPYLYYYYYWFSGR